MTLNDDDDDVPISSIFRDVGGGITNHMFMHRLYVENGVFMRGMQGFAPSVRISGVITQVPSPWVGCVLYPECG